MPPKPLVGKGAVAEGSIETGLTRDHGSEVPVEWVSVPEGRVKGGRTRDPATEVPVAGVIVSE